MPKIGLDDFFAVGNSVADFYATVVDDLPTPNPEWEPPISLDDPPLPLFPVDSFDDAMRDFALAEAEATQTPVDLAATVMIGTLGTAARQAFKIEVDPGYTEPTNLYVMTFLASANRKSSVFADVTAPVINYERAQAAEDRKAHDLWKSQRKIDEMEQKRLEAIAASDKGTELDRDRAIKNDERMAANKEPKITKILFDDVTPEKMSTALADHGFIGIHSSEGGALFGNIGGRYSSGMPSFDTYLKAATDDEIRIDRQGRESQYIPFARMSLVLSPQPVVADQIGKIAGFRERGGAGRIYPSFPKSLVGYRKIKTTAVTDKCRKEWTDIVSSILKLKPSRMTDSDGNLIPARIYLSPEARTAHYAFQEEIEERMRPGADLHSITDWAGKSAGAAIRIAGLLHLARYACTLTPEETPIEVDTMNRAISIIRYYIPHAEVFYDHLTEAGDLSNARTVWTALQKLGQETTKQKLYQALRGSSAFRTADKLDDPLQLLEDYNYVKTFKVVPTTKHGDRGGRPQVKIAVNPLSVTPKTPNTPRTPDTAQSDGVSESFRDVPAAIDVEFDEFEFGWPA